MEQRYSLMFSDLDHQEHEWTIAPVGPATKCCSLQLAATTGPITSGSPAESEADDVWHLLGDMDLPRSMLLAGGIAALRAPQGGDAAGAKRKLPLDEDLPAGHGSLMLIGPETYTKEMPSSPRISPIEQ